MATPDERGRAGNTTWRSARSAPRASRKTMRLLGVPESRMESRDAYGAERPRFERPRRAILGARTGALTSCIPDDYFSNAPAPVAARSGSLSSFSELDCAAAGAHRGAMSTPDTDKVFTGSIPKLYETYLVPLIFEPYAAGSGGAAEVEAAFRRAGGRRGHGRGDSRARVPAAWAACPSSLRT